MRVLVVLMLLAPLATTQGCATQDRAAREDAALAESEDDAFCRNKGAPDTEAYEACRKGRADARAQAAAVQEQRRRDFDRTLGAGTEGQTSF